MGISDVTEDTLAFGIYLPNTLVTYNGSNPEFFDDNGNPMKVGQNPDANWTTNFSLINNQTEYGLFSVKDIETITGYNFWSNIPTETQEIIEDRETNWILHELNQIEQIGQIEPASLMAELGIDGLLPSGKWTLHNASISQDSFPNQIKLTTDNFIGNSGILEVSPSQITVLDVTNPSSAKRGFCGIDITHIGSSQNGSFAKSLEQVGRTDISITQTGIRQISPSQASTKQIGIRQISSFQNDIFQLSSTQIDASQVSILKSVDIVRSVIFGHDRLVNQFNSSKVSFSSGISSQQFARGEFPSGEFPNHNSTTQIINELNNSATNIWSDLLQSSTQLDINFQITDLSTGQLAEATITGFDLSWKRQKSQRLILQILFKGSYLIVFLELSKIFNTYFTCA